MVWGIEVAEGVCFALCASRHEHLDIAATSAVVGSGSLRHEPFMAPASLSSTHLDTTSGNAGKLSASIHLDKVGGTTPASHLLLKRGGLSTTKVTASKYGGLESGCAGWWWGATVTAWTTYWLGMASTASGYGRGYARFGIKRQCLKQLHSLRIDIHNLLILFDLIFIIMAEYGNS